jgi:hypothetical protein
MRGLRNNKFIPNTTEKNVMNTARKSNARGLLLACLGLLLTTTSTRAQIGDPMIKDYIAAANSLTGTLAQMTDADKAQRNAPNLIGPIALLNARLTQLKTLYSIPGSAPALEANAAALTTAQTRLAGEQKRLLTGYCDQEGTITSLSFNDAIQVTFANRSSVPVQLFWIDYNGNRVPYEKIGVNQDHIGSTYATHPWLVADEKGRCLLVVQPMESTQITINPILAPTVAPFLAKIAK